MSISDRDDDPFSYTPLARKRRRIQASDKVHYAPSSKIAHKQAKETARRALHVMDNTPTTSLMVSTNASSDIRKDSVASEHMAPRINNADLHDVGCCDYIKQENQNDHCCPIKREAVKTEPQSQKTINSETSEVAGSVAQDILGAVKDEASGYTHLKAPNEETADVAAEYVQWLHDLSHDSIEDLFDDADFCSSTRIEGDDTVTTSTRSDDEVTDQNVQKRKASTSTISKNEVETRPEDVMASQTVIRSTRPESTVASQVAQKSSTITKSRDVKNKTDVEARQPLISSMFGATQSSTTQVKTQGGQGTLDAFLGVSGKATLPTDPTATKKVTQNCQKRPAVENDRKCPFYKRIPGTGITVDAFNYGDIPDCTMYFLSHFHYDHYQGLTKKFRGKIYCSQITANLVKLKIGIPSSQIHVLPMETPVTVNDLEVTLLEANHCPGSVLFVIKATSGIYLHTGDFRAHESMQQLAWFQQLQGRVATLYLDTTYCDPQYDFPAQELVLDAVRRVTLDKVRKDTVVVVGSYTVGKERVFMAVAEALNSHIYAPDEKLRILRCLEDRDLQSRLTSSPAHAQVHVLSMRQFNVKCLTAHLAKVGHRYSQLVAFEPTGWAHSNQNSNIKQLQPKLRQGNVTIYAVPYSEHSSYTDLQRFVQFIRPIRIIPTVNNGSAASRQKMEQHFAKWRAK